MTTATKTRQPKRTRASSSSASPPPSFRPPKYASPQRLINGQLPPTYGGLVARWIERNLVHGEGDYLGEDVRLEPFQRYVLNRLYEYDPATGRLLYDRALIGIPKGNGKTALAGAIGLNELAGPVAPVSPNVAVSAASWEQADKLFGAARLMASHERSRLKPYVLPFDSEIQLRDGVGIMRRIAAVAGTNDGGLETYHIGDEVHEWEGESRERVYVVLGNSLKKRTPRSPSGRVGGQQLGISTAGATKDSLLGRLYEHGRKVADGTITDDRFLFIWWEASDGWDLTSRDGLVGAILEANPAAGSYLSVENLVDRYADPEAGGYEFERYHLNRWVSAPERWIGDAAWDALRGAGEPPDGTAIAIGMDGSANRDNTALIGCTIPQTADEKPHLFVIGVWVRDPRDPNWVVPRSEVDAALAKAMQRWRVQRVACDPAGWYSEIEAWADEFGAEVIEVVPQTAERMAVAADRMRAAALDRRLSHDGNAVLARNVANCHTRETRWGLSIRKDFPMSPRKIDAAVAAVLAYDAIGADPEPEDKVPRLW